jgi:hypothetical protein
MQKLFSCRNIASFLFIATFFIFVLAQRYTRENGPKGLQVVGTEILVNKAGERLTENNVSLDSTVSSAITQ